MNALEIYNLRKQYGDFLLNDISLTLPSGCIMGLIGENGAGKSTTIQLIMNAVVPDGGSVNVLGTDHQSPEFNARKEEIGVVLDEAYFPEVLNAKQVNEIMKITYRRWEEACYFQYLKRFHLPEGKAFKDYSRGMKMKLAIAVAMSHQPKLLILDEATGGLDPIVRDEILELFYEFTRSEEHSILISSHIVSDLEKLCDYIAFLHEGRLVLCQEKDRILEEYGIVRVQKANFEAIPQEAVMGMRATDYAVEALVRRSELSSAFSVEHTTIEDIILLLVKGGKDI